MPPSLTVFSILLVLKVEDILPPNTSWFIVLSPLFASDGINAYFCIIVFIRQYLYQELSNAPLRTLWSLLVIGESTPNIQDFFSSTYSRIGHFTTPFELNSLLWIIIIDICAFHKKVPLLFFVRAYYLIYLPTLYLFIIYFWILTLPVVLFGFKYLLCQKLNDSIKLEYSEVMSPIFILLQLGTSFKLVICFVPMYHS